MNEHKGISNQLLWFSDHFKLSVDDSILQKTPFSFDVSGWELFCPLLVGARMVIALPDGHKNTEYLVGIICNKGITTIQFVPSMLRIFLEQPGIEKCNAYLKRVLCAGEALPSDLQERFFKILPDVELHNLYGPTETAISVTHTACQPADKGYIVSIGRPEANTQIYMLDAKMQPVPTGARGEIYIGGIQVGRGYIARDDLTAERFIPDPFASKSGSRLYKTGDVARYLPDGNIEYLGRVDSQVKLRGQRVELGEIEVVIGEHPKMHQAAVYLCKLSPEDVRIVACCVTKQSESLTLVELLKYLRKKLPAYMIPQHVQFMDAIPLTSNGKVDRLKLPEPVLEKYSMAQFEAPVGRFESTIAEIWANTLKMSRPISRNDRFFEIGGHSLLAVHYLIKLDKELSVKHDLQLLMKDSLKEIAHYVQLLVEQRDKL